MNRRPLIPIRSPLVALAAAWWLALGCLGAGAKAQSATDDVIDPAQIPAAVRGLQYQDRLGASLPLDLKFTDSFGKAVELNRYFTGMSAKQPKPVLLLLVYLRCPMICPGMIARAQERLGQLEIAAGDQFNFMVVSFDPTDTPAKAAEFRARSLETYKHKDRVKAAEARGEDSWAFLVDSSGSGMKLAEAVGFPVRYQPAANEYAHGSDMFILSPDGKLSRYLGFDPPAQTLRLSLVEASEGKIATTLDRVLLWCFHFDPNANSYVVQAWRVMQVGGAVSALTLGAVLFWMFRIERRRRVRLSAAGLSSSSSSTFVLRSDLRTPAGA